MRIFQRQKQLSQNIQIKKRERNRKEVETVKRTVDNENNKKRRCGPVKQLVDRKKLVPKKSSRFTFRLQQTLANTKKRLEK